jgi:hypothetical protein
MSLVVGRVELHLANAGHDRPLHIPAGNSPSCVTPDNYLLKSDDYSPDQL